MGRRIPLRALSFALVLALAVAGVVLAVYDLHGAAVTLAIVAPLSLLTVLAGEAIAVHRPGGLRRQFAAVAALGALQLAAGAVLFVALMYVSSHDALLTVLLAAYAGALVWWIARRLGSRALADVDAIGATLSAVGEGSTGSTPLRSTGWATPRRSSAARSRVSIRARSCSPRRGCSTAVTTASATTSRATRSCARWS